MHNNRILLILILFLAALLRLNNLASVPPPFNVDEAANAYDAFSVLKTGKDQWGNVLPITFRAFNDYRKPATIYSAIPFIALFNLTVFSIRAMAAFWGWWAVLFIYRLGSDMFNQRVALLSALLLAISPWHVVFSRLGVEVSGPLLTSVIAGIDLIWRWWRTHQPHWLIASAIAFSLSIYSYTVAQAFTPLMLLTLIIVFGRDFRRNYRIGLLALGLIALLVLPLVISMIVNPLSWNRFEKIAVLNPPYLKSIPVLIKQWAGYFMPSFLFIRGDANPIHHPPGSGQLLWLEAFLIPLGLARIALTLAHKFTVKSRRQFTKLKDMVAQTPARASFLIAALLFLGAVPAALTIQDMASANAMRGILSLPGWILLSALGVDTLWGMMPKRLNHSLHVMTIGLLLANSAIVLHNYFDPYTKKYARAFEYGIQEAMLFVLEHEAEYNKIILTDWISQPHIFAVFFTRYDPGAFQNNHAPYGNKLSEKLTAWGTKYETGDVDKLYNEIGHGLLVARPHMLTGIEPDKIIYHPDGTIAFKIISK